MKEYVTLSLETHLFFGRIMKEVSELVLNYPLLIEHILREAKLYRQIILELEIRSIILPLLADHVLREANHYLRILEHAQKGGDSYGVM